LSSSTIVSQHAETQKHSKSTGLRQGESSPDLDDFQNLTQSSLSKDRSVITLSWRSDQFIPEIRVKLRILSRGVEEHF